MTKKRPAKPRRQSRAQPKKADPKGWPDVAYACVEKFGFWRLLSTIVVVILAWHLAPRIAVLVTP
jgi:hypothetical protein